MSLDICTLLCHDSQLMKSFCELVTDHMYETVVVKLSFTVLSTGILLVNSCIRSFLLLV